MDKKLLTEMFDNLLHIGNKTNYWNPHMNEYIHSSSNGVHIIDLTQTITQIEEVKKALQDFHVNGKKVLFVATKLQARDAFSKLATETGNFYVTEKWVPGLLTNFKTIKKRISTYLKLLRDSEGVGFDMLTKKERAAKMLELEKLDKAFAGLKTMKRTPDALFVVDGVFESQAVKEAKTLGIPCFAISNTNGEPYNVTEAIPANTNSVKALDYLAVSLKSAFSGTVKTKNDIKKPTGKAPIKKADSVKAETEIKKEEKKAEK